MSVVSGPARRRWLVVAAGVALLVAGVVARPAAAELLAGRPADAADPREVLGRAITAAPAYSALSESRGTLGLPDLPGLGGVAALLGGTTRARVWWSGPRAWRVAVLDQTGERDTYGTPDGVVEWFYERRELETTVGEPGARLPRADDLVAPAAARRLLAGVGPADRVVSLGTRRVAGRWADGVRVTPDARASTIGHADVWVDRESGLPLRLEVVDRVGVEALATTLSEVSLTRPPAAVVHSPPTSTARRELLTAPDLVAAVDRATPWPMPDSLAGLPATRSLLEGTGRTASGLVRLVVLPLPGRVTREALANAERPRVGRR